MASAIMPGRAEFDKDVESCFEAIPVKYLFAPLFHDNSPKLVIGGIGTGKTHLTLLLGNEIPTKHFHLDKQRLLEEGEADYTPLRKSPNPKAIIVDDLHYLLSTMTAYKLKPKAKRIDETAVLKKLEDFVQLAGEHDAVPIFIADEGPAGLAMRFEDGENRKRFLRILEGCVDTGDDAKYFLDYLDITGSEKGGTINLNYRGIQWADRHDITFATAYKFWPEELREGMNISAEQLEDLAKRTDDSAKYKRENLAWEFIDQTQRSIHNTIAMAYDNIAKTFKIADVPYRVYDHKKAFYPMTQEGLMSGMTFISKIRTKNKWREDDDLSEGLIEETPDYETRNFTNYWEKTFLMSRPIATIRQIKVISENAGGFSRESLGLKNIGKKFDGQYGAENHADIKSPKKWNGMLYMPDDIKAIRRVIAKNYNRIVNFSYAELTREFAKAETAEEAVANMILYEQKLE